MYLRKLSHLEIFSILMEKVRENLKNCPEQEMVDVILKQISLAEMMDWLVDFITFQESLQNELIKKFDAAIVSSDKIHQHFLKLKSVFKLLNRALHMLHLELLSQGKDQIVDSAINVLMRGEPSDPLLKKMDDPEEFIKFIKDHFGEMTFPKQILVLMFFIKYKKLCDVNKVKLPVIAWGNKNPFIYRMVCKYFAKNIAPKNLLDMLVDHYGDDFHPKEVHFLMKTKLLPYFSTVLNEKKPETESFYRRRGKQARDIAPKLMAHVEALYEDSLKPVILSKVEPVILSEAKDLFDIPRLSN